VGSREPSGGSVGPTNHTTSDLNGSVAPLPISAEYAGKDAESLSGVWGGAPGLARASAGQPLIPTN
jgi:hypothetical protein